LWGLFGLLLAVVIGGGLLALRSGGLTAVGTRDMLRPLGDVPDFVLYERGGQSVTKASLLGKVWVVDFIFTRCVDKCPLASSRMAQLQKVFAAEDAVRLVSITVDPEHDTPVVLRQYAENFGAHPQRWLFLTGDKERIYRLAREGFHLGVVDPHEADQAAAIRRWPEVWNVARPVLQALEPATALAHHGTHPEAKQAIQHSARFVLVDRHGQIRQYYDSEDEGALLRLQQHVQLLLKER
jgi:protein SCO1/2